MNNLDHLTRRVSFPKLEHPAPSTEQLVQLFTAANRAPDHKQLKPWRFKVITNSHLNQFGQLMVDYAIKNLGMTESEAEKMRQKPHRAPMIIVAITHFVDHPKVPKVEQTLAVGAAIQNLMLASDMLGFGCMWRTGSFAFSEELSKALSLGNNEDVSGIIYIGTPPDKRKSIRAPNLDDFVSYWRG